MSIRNIYDPARYDFRFQKYVGWRENVAYSMNYNLLFSEESIDAIAREIQRRLFPTGHTVNVSRDVIGSVMSNVAQHHNPVIGDIHTRYIVPNSVSRNDFDRIREQTITVIVNTIIDEIEVAKLNQRLSIWSTVYGDFNTEGLRAHPIIRKKENDYMKGMFAMNY